MRALGFTTWADIRTSKPRYTTFRPDLWSWACRHCGAKAARIMDINHSDDCPVLYRTVADFEGY